MGMGNSESSFRCQCLYILIYAYCINNFLLFYPIWQNKRVSFVPAEGEIRLNVASQ